MPYALADIEITQPLPELALLPGQTGVGVLLRKRDRPIGFFLAPLPSGTRLSSTDVGDLVGGFAARDILAANIADELIGERPQPGPLNLTVAICTRNRPGLLETCLRALLAIRDDDLNRFEVLVVDNAPSDTSTEDMVASIQRVRYAREPRPGLNFARNFALAAVTTEFLAFIDDDATVDRGWLIGLREAWAEHPDAALVTGQVLPYELATDAQVRFEADGGFHGGFEKIRFTGQARHGNPLYPTGPGVFGAGCNMALRVDAFRCLGGFDEALDTGPPLPGGGDLDAFYRIVRAGLPLVYEPRALVFHRHRQDMEGLRHQYWTWGTGFTAFLHKSYRSDPEMRPMLRAMYIWWFVDQLKRGVKGYRRQALPSPRMLFAELAGGVVTLPWMYPLSLRRTERIRRQFR